MIRETASIVRFTDPDSFKEYFFPHILERGMIYPVCYLRAPYSCLYISITKPTDKEIQMSTTSKQIIILLNFLIISSDGRHLKDQKEMSKIILSPQFHEKLHQMNFMAQKIFVDMFSLNQMFHNILESSLEGEKGKSATMVKLIKTMEAIK